MAQQLEGSVLHIFVSLKQLSYTCHVSLLAALDTDHKHKVSLTHLIYFSCLSDILTNTQDLWYSIHFHPAMFHGRVADQRKAHLSHFTAVNPLFIDHYRKKDHNVTKPRIAVYKHLLKSTSKYRFLV